MPRPTPQLVFAPSVGAPDVSLAATFLEELTRAYVQTKDANVKVRRRLSAHETNELHRDEDDRAREE